MRVDLPSFGIDQSGGNCSSVDLDRAENQEETMVRIVILLGAPLTKQNFERVGIPYLSLYFDVCVFDCMALLNSNLNADKFTRVEWSRYVNIKTQDDLEKAIYKIKPNYFIDFVGGGYSFDRVLLKKAGAKVVTLQIESYPVPGVLSRTVDYISGKSDLPVKQLGTSTIPINITNTSNHPLSLIKKIFSKIVNKLNYYRYTTPYDIALLGGNKAGDHFSRSRSHVIHVGTPDYHDFNRFAAGLVNKNCNNENYILFIDDYLPYAHDFELLRLKCPVTSNIYYPIVHDFFEKIESHFGLPVVIAGHPGSKLDTNLSERMGGRKVVYDKTHVLAAQSTMVLAHASTAASYAVLARKPILFLTTKELQNSFLGAYIKCKAKSLGRPLVLMDQLSDIDFSRYSRKISEKKYSLYETDYLRSHLSRETKPWEMFIEYVQERASGLNLQSSIR